MTIYAVIRSGYFDTGCEFDRWSDEKQKLFLSLDKAIEYCESIPNEELIEWCGGEAEPWYITLDKKWSKKELEESNNNLDGTLYLYGRNLDIADDLNHPCWTAGVSIIIKEQEVIE